MQAMAPDLRRKVDANRAARLAREAGGVVSKEDGAGVFSLYAFPCVSYIPSDRVAQIREGRGLFFYNGHVP